MIREQGVDRVTDRIALYWALNLKKFRYLSGYEDGTLASSRAILTPCNNFGPPRIECVISLFATRGKMGKMCSRLNHDL